MLMPARFADPVTGHLIDLKHFSDPRHFDRFRARTGISAAYLAFLQAAIMLGRGLIRTVSRQRCYDRQTFGQFFSRLGGVHVLSLPPRNRFMAA